MARINGDSTNNILIGGTESDELYGFGGDDVLIGNAENDWLSGGSGQDTLFGGVGDDTYRVDNVRDKVKEFDGEGFDTVKSSVSFSLTYRVESLFLTGSSVINGIGNVMGNTLVGNANANTLIGREGNDSLKGGMGNDSLDGGLGRDWLDGGLGVDTLVGGMANDTYVVDSSKDRIKEGLNFGIDTVLSSVSFDLAANIENLTLTGSAASNGYGNLLNNIITGNAAANELRSYAGDDRLQGQGGADILFGRKGNDTLNGGSGIDTLVGGRDQDTYIVDDTNDIIKEGKQRENGTDTALASVGYTLGAYVENLVLVGVTAINGTGNGLVNRIEGNSAANKLHGGGGSDYLYGKGGDDELDCDGYLYGGAGNDVIKTTYFSYRNGLIDGGKGGNDVLTLTASNQEIYFSSGKILGVETIKFIGTGNHFQLKVQDFSTMELSGNKLTLDNAAGDYLFLEEEWVSQGINAEGFKVLTRQDVTVEINPDTIIAHTYFLNVASAPQVGGFFTDGVDYIVIDFGMEYYMAARDMPGGTIDLTGFGLEDVLVINQRDGLLAGKLAEYHPESSHRASYILQTYLVAIGSFSPEYYIDRVSWKTGASTARLVSSFKNTFDPTEGRINGSVLITGLPVGLTDSQFIFV
ncbi:MAG: calcium-binding protein [Methylovulum sp.]|nr:calcium-binding protein [Methylovulum sp.]